MGVVHWNGPRESPPLRVATRKEWRNITGDHLFFDDRTRSERWQRSTILAFVAVCVRFMFVHRYITKCPWIKPMNYIVRGNDAGFNIWFGLVPCIPLAAGFGPVSTPSWFSIR